MKKFYILLITAGLFSAANGFAQNRIASGKVMKIQPSQFTSKKQSPVNPMVATDTLTNHWDVIGPVVAVDTAVTYTAGGGGFVAGQNTYGDLAKAQRFDSNYGVTSSNGTITNLLLWVGGKVQNAGTAAWTPTIWADNAGKPGTVLGTATPITVAQMDTSAAGILGLIGSSAAIKGLFNINATFSPAIAIPSNQIFWAGYSMTYVAGDSAGLVTSRDATMPKDAPGVSGNFPAASTHTYELWSPSPWTSFNDGTGNTWQLDVALAVYPVLDIATGVNENNTNVLWMQNVPNPASSHTMINYELKETSDVMISVYDITGNKVASFVQGIQSAGKHNLKMDVSNFSAGMYFYTLNAGSNQLTNKMTVVK